MILGYFPHLYWSPGVELLEIIHLYLKHTLGVLLSKPVGDFPCLVTGRPSFRMYTNTMSSVSKIISGLSWLSFVTTLRCVLFLWVSLRRRSRGRSINSATQFLTMFRGSKLLSCLMSQKLSSACLITDSSLHRSSLYRTLESQRVARASTAVLCPLSSKWCAVVSRPTEEN